MLLSLLVLYSALKVTYDQRFAEIEKSKDSCNNLLKTKVCTDSELELKTAEVNNCAHCRIVNSSDTRTKAMWITFQEYNLCSGKTCIKWGETIGSHIVTIVYFLLGLATLAFVTAILCILKMGSRASDNSHYSLPITSSKWLGTSKGPTIVEVNSPSAVPSNSNLRLRHTN